VDQFDEYSKSWLEDSFASKLIKSLVTIAAAIRCSSCSIPVVVNWYLMLFAKRYSQYSINHLCYYSSSIVVIIRVAIEVVKVVIAVVIVLVTLIL